MTFTSKFLILLWLTPLLATTGRCENNLPSYYQYCSSFLPIMDRAIELQCCHVTVKNFQSSWANGGFYLSRYLELLRTWRCPQFYQECYERHYEFTEFNKLTYDLYCDKPKLRERCTDTLQEILNYSLTTSAQPLPGELAEDKNTDSILMMTTSYKSAQNSSSNNESFTLWNSIIAQLDVAKLNKETVLHPCVQVAQIETYYGKDGDYHEISEVYVPFCSIIWCGASRTVVEQKGISTWDCMPQRCRTNITIIMTVLSVLSVAIIVANILVIIVFTTTPKLQNSQAAFKISLAVADLLIGSVVFPAFVISLYKITMTPAKMGGLYDLKQINSTYKTMINWTLVPMPGRNGTHVYLTTGYFQELFQNRYVYFVGCVTAASLGISLYTLMMASFDRFLAVYRPMKFRKYRAKKLAVRVLIAIWTLNIFLSLLPFFVSDLSYGLVASILIAFGGTYVLVFYVIAFFIPIFTVWTTNILIFTFVRKQSKIRRRMASKSLNRRSEIKRENRLAVTLSIIVGVFTLSALPAAVVSLTAALNLPALSYDPPGSYDPTAHSVFNTTEFLAVVILMSNSLWNCLIYSARNKDFKAATMELHRKMMKACAREGRQHTTDIFRVVVAHKKLSEQSSYTSTRSKTPPSNDECGPSDGTESLPRSATITEAVSENPTGNSAIEMRPLERHDSLFGSFKLKLNTDRLLASIMRRVNNRESTTNRRSTTTSSHTTNEFETIQEEVGV